MRCCCRSSASALGRELQTHRRSVADREQGWEERRAKALQRREELQQRTRIHAASLSTLSFQQPHSEPEPEAKPEPKPEPPPDTKSEPAKVRSSLTAEAELVQQDWLSLSSCRRLQASLRPSTRGVICTSAPRIQCLGQGGSCCKVCSASCSDSRPLLLLFAAFALTAGWIRLSLTCQPAHAGIKLASKLAREDVLQRRGRKEAAREAGQEDRAGPAEAEVSRAVRGLQAAEWVSSRSARCSRAEASHVCCTRDTLETGCAGQYAPLSCHCCTSQYAKAAAAADTCLSTRRMCRLRWTLGTSK